MTAELLATLRAIVGSENLLHDPADCWPYGYDNSRREALPEAVLFPQDHAQTLKVIRFCNQHKIAVTARGKGTGTTGATVPLFGGVVLSFERMREIIKVDPANRVMVVAPGVTNQEVQKAAGEHGFFWPPDPTSAAVCTIGGNLAYNSSGPRAVKYGTPRENTLGLRAITGDGREIRCGVYTTKGVVGYDLTRLLIGSEGTLAIITEATLKLTPLPEAKRTLQAVYATIDDAAKAVSAIMAQAVVPCALEFIDGTAIEMIRNYSKADLPSGAGAMLMIEVDGLSASLDEAVEKVSNAARNKGLVELTTATTQAEVQALWNTRKALSPALRNVAPKKINEDIVVPVSRLPELTRELQRLSKQYNIPIVNFGHAGNGNLHTNLLLDPDDPQQMKDAEACLDAVFDLVLKLNGTISGEHGIGIVKREFVRREIDEVTLGLMRQIKQQFDPNGILNAGKTIPAASTE
ncbi:MAG: FAD-binding oxidoreductase [Thiotrichales bacterium]|nr:MAG: FAD-binding oxidoreductase [Thiotrichales bacterium]